MKFLKSKFKDQKGQFLIEGILLMTIMLSLLLFGVKTMREKKVIASMVEGPWNYSGGMIECGIWGTSKKVCGRHPNVAADRGITLTEFNP